MTFNEMIQSDKPVLVDFFATWCGPCKMMAPALEEVKKKIGDAVTIIKIDVDKNQKAAQHYNISGVPTLMLFKKGQLLWRQSGAQPAHIIENVLKQNM